MNHGCKKMKGYFPMGQNVPAQDQRWLKRNHTIISLKCIMRTFIHPFWRVNELLERRFTLQKGWTYSPLRVNHPSDGWMWTERVNKTFMKVNWSTNVKNIKECIQYMSAVKCVDIICLWELLWIGIYDF
jgi:hypothetical protein